MKWNLCKVLVSDSSKHLEKLETCTLTLRFVTNYLSLSNIWNFAHSLAIFQALWNSEALSNFFFKQARVMKQNETSTFSKHIQNDILEHCLNNHNTTIHNTNITQ